MHHSSGATPDQVYGTRTIAYAGAAVRQDPDDVGCVAASAVAFLGEFGIHIPYQEAKNAIPTMTIGTVTGRRLSDAVVFINRKAPNLTPPVVFRSLVGIDFIKSELSQGRKVIVGLDGVTSVPGGLTANFRHAVVVVGTKVENGVTYFLILDSADILTDNSFGLDEARFAQLYSNQAIIQL